MRQVKNPDELRAALRGPRLNGQSIGFVPTMGNLHAGHLALVRQARVRCDRVVASIFVNPLQFDRSEDLAAYPRTLEEDARRLAEEGVDVLFAPAARDVLGDDPKGLTRVQVPRLSERLEGAARPGHFTGVATIVTKLFNLVQPDVAVFGEKDYQQLLIVRKLVRDLNMPVQIESAPTVREPDGLAMSSRNAYLTPEQRARAPRLYRIISALAEAIQVGKRNYRDLEKNGMDLLRKFGFRPEYVAICQADTLLPANPGDRDLVVLAAAWLGRARLIDNVPLRLKPPG